jgi:hypothetical protein
MLNDIFLKYSKTKIFLDKELLYNFYEQASNNVTSGQIDNGIWAKSFADAKGDVQLAKAIYLDLIVEKMIDDHVSTLELKKQELIIEEQRQRQIQENTKKEVQLAQALEEAKAQEEMDKKFPGPDLMMAIGFIIAIMSMFHIASVIEIIEYSFIAGIFTFVVIYFAIVVVLAMLKMFIYSLSLEATKENIITFVGLILILLTLLLEHFK